MWVLNSLRSPDLLEFTVPNGRSNRVSGAKVHRANVMPQAFYSDCRIPRSR